MICGEGSTGLLSPFNALLKSRSISRGVSLCIRPLRLRLFPGVLAALARSRRARIAWGVVGTFRRDGSGRVAGPPRGVRPVPGVRKSGVVRRSGVFLLPGVGPALAARRRGVLGVVGALGVAVLGISGDVRGFLRAESDMIAGGVDMRLLMRSIGERVGGTRFPRSSAV
jgi:hypothetical protein